jgi:hypothetical protein
VLLQRRADSCGAIGATDTVVSGLEGAASRPAIAKVQQIGPDLFFREQVGRPLVMGSQAANAVNVDLLRLHMIIESGQL